MNNRSGTSAFRLTLTLVAIAHFSAGTVLAEPPSVAPTEAAVDEPDERPDDSYMHVPRALRRTTPAPRVQAGGHVSVQVNVDAQGNNLVGDAANEPSLAVDPTNPSRMAIGWRQFDTIASNFRQAGFAYSTDSGATWTFPGVLEPAVFRSDPVLDFDVQGGFYYNSLEGDFTTDLFQSSDGGATWDSGVYAFGGDKQWMAIDRTSGASQGHIYQNWYGPIGCCPPAMFNRSTDAGSTFETPIEIGDGLRRGTTTVGPDGAVYVTGHLPTDFSVFLVAKSTSASDPGATPSIDFIATVDLGGSFVRGAGPNPDGMLSQVWLVADPTNANRVYLLSSIDPPGDDPLDIHFSRSLDGGATWSVPVRINTDPVDNGAWQWFATLGVAPNGRIDVVWNDTRADPGGFASVVYYAFSEDAGVTWSANEPLTPAWDPHLGFPNQDKIGDYYDLVSFNDAAHLAYAATFNGEQDIYYLRIEPSASELIFADGFEAGDLDLWTVF